MLRWRLRSTTISISTRSRRNSDASAAPTLRRPLTSIEVGETRSGPELHCHPPINTGGMPLSNALDRCVESGLAYYFARIALITLCSRGGQCSPCLKSGERFVHLQCAPGSIAGHWRRDGRMSSAPWSAAHVRLAPEHHRRIAGRWLAGSQGSFAPTRFVGRIAFSLNVTSRRSFSWTLGRDDKTRCDWLQGP